MVCSTDSSIASGSINGGKELFKQFTSLGRIKDITGFVDAKLFKDDGQFLFQHLADTEFNRIFKDEVDGALSSAVRSDPRARCAVPAAWGSGNVVIDHHMAELQV
ncbi:MAG: hypothetical protein R3A44_30940 [Caldilineaceae bacterium]